MNMKQKKFGGTPFSDKPIKLEWKVMKSGIVDHSCWDFSKEMVSSTSKIIKIRVLPSIFWGFNYAGFAVAIESWVNASVKRWFPNGVPTFPEICRVFFQILIFNPPKKTLWMVAKSCINWWRISPPSTAGKPKWPDHWSYAIFLFLQGLWMEIGYPSPPKKCMSGG